MDNSRESEDLSGSRTSRETKPCEANNSFVKKMATKVTELMPQKSWISKWFNTSQDISEVEDLNKVNDKYTEVDDETDQAPPPLKRARIREDRIHPPGTWKFSYGTSKQRQKYISDFTLDSTIDDFEPAIAGPSGSRQLLTSTPAMSLEFRSVANQRSDLNSLVTTQNNGAANGMDDNSESSESTSGCSSLIPQNNRQDEQSTINYESSYSSTKKKFSDALMEQSNHYMSKPSPKTLYLDQSNRKTLGRKRPAFDASFMNNSLDKSATLSSPFYSGNTTYGGANAANLFRTGRNLLNSTSEIQLKVPKRITVQVQPPTNDNDSSGMSQTAKRILETLQNFSSPITDAKRMPIKSRRNDSLPYFGGKKVSRDEEGMPTSRVGLRHLTKELVVPTMADILRIKRKQKLQNSTIAARKIMSAGNVRSPPVKEYHIRNDTDSGPKFQGKLKSNRKTKSCLEDEETVPTVNLPNIALPISTLPRFDIALPQNSTQKLSSQSKEIFDSFKFASPLKVTETPKKTLAINSFTFSKPLIVKEKNTESSIESSKTVILDSSTQNSISTPNFMFPNSSKSLKLKMKKSDADSGIDSGELKSGSVMDILGDESNESPKKKLKSSSTEPTEGTFWECAECYIKNYEKDDKCSACKAKKPTVQSSKNQKINSDFTESQKNETIKSNNFGNNFKKSTSQWECDSCMVRNKDTDSKCVCCQTPKPLPKGNAVLHNSNLSLNAMPTFLSKDNNVSSRSLSDSSSIQSTKITKNESEMWECPVCMVMNASNKLTCPCCDAPKPSKGISKKSSSSTLGVFKSTFTTVNNEPEKQKEDNNVLGKSQSTLKFNCVMPSDTTQFKFGINHSDKPVTNSTTSSVTLPTTTETKTPSFSFGLPKASEPQAAKPTDNSTSNTSTTVTTQKPTISSVISFGINNTTTKKPEESKETKKEDSENKPKAAWPLPSSGSTGFSFGIPTTKTEQKTAQFSFGSSAVKDTTPSMGFSFGASKTSFGATETNTKETEKPLFGNTNTTSQTTTTIVNTSTTLTFKAPTASTEPKVTESAPTPTFSFGAASSTASSEKSITEQKTPAPPFGGSASLTQTSLPSFGTPTTASPLFGGTEVKTPMSLGFGEKKAPALFGSVENKPASFGENQSKVSLFPAFGSCTSTSSNDKPNTSLSFPGTNFGPPVAATSFGNTATTPFFTNQKTETPSTVSTGTPSLFTFGSGSSQTSQSSTGGFNFPATNTPEQPQKPLFTFGATNNSSAQSQPNNSFGSGFNVATPAATPTPLSAFSFGASKSEGTPTPFGQLGAATTSMFNAPQATPTLSQPGLSFPSTNAGLSTGFGSSPKPEGFNFNPMAQQAPATSSTGGYNFNAANARPQFNFTGGNAPPVFNAAPQANSTRKIKKAVRRIPPR